MGPRPLVVVIVFVFVIVFVSLFALWQHPIVLAERVSYAEFKRVEPFFFFEIEVSCISEELQYVKV